MLECIRGESFKLREHGDVRNKRLRDIRTQRVGYCLRSQNRIRHMGPTERE
jgi:hypothetical protein